MAAVRTPDGQPPLVGGGVVVAVTPGARSCSKARPDAKSAIADRPRLSLACGIPFHALWAHKIGYGTRVTLRVGSGEPIWGEIIEIVEA